MPPPAFPEDEAEREVRCSLFGGVEDAGLQETGAADHGPGAEGASPMTAWFGVSPADVDDGERRVFGDQPLQPLIGDLAQPLA